MGWVETDRKWENGRDSENLKNIQGKNQGKGCKMNQANKAKLHKRCATKHTHMHTQCCNGGPSKSLAAL